MEGGQKNSIQLHVQPYLCMLTLDYKTPVYIGLQWILFFLHLKQTFFFKSMLLYNSYMVTTVCIYSTNMDKHKGKEKNRTLVSCMKVKRAISHPPHPCVSAMPYNVYGTYYTTCMRREH